MRKTSPQDIKRILRWSVLVCLLLDLAIGGFLLSPWSPSKAAGEQRLSELTIQYRQLEARVQALDRLQSRIRTSQEQIQKLQTASMPAEHEVSSVVLAEVHRIAQDSHVTAQGMSFKPDTKSREGLRKVQIQVLVTGDYDSVVQFINQIERSPIFFVIDGVSASAGRADSSGQVPEGSIRLLVSLETYVRVDAATTSGDQKA